MAEHEVRTELPGVFYRRPTPDAAPFAEPGQQVTVGQTIGLVEIMKQYSELTTPVAGTLTRFVVADTDMVEADQTVAVVEAG